MLTNPASFNLKPSSDEMFSSIVKLYSVDVSATTIVSTLLVNSPTPASNEILSSKFSFNKLVTFSDSFSLFLSRNSPNGSLLLLIAVVISAL